MAEPILPDKLKLTQQQTKANPCNSLRYLSNNWILSWVLEQPSSPRQSTAEERPRLADHAQHEHVQRSCFRLPISAVNREDERLWDAKQPDDQQSDLGKRHVKESQEALTSFVMRVLFGSPTHHRRDLHQTDCLDLNECERKLRQKVDAALFQVTFSASVRSSGECRPLCSCPFKKCLATNLVKDSGTMAFYAVSKINFCPVLSACR